MDKLWRWIEPRMRMVVFVVLLGLLGFVYYLRSQDGVDATLVSEPSRRTAELDSPETWESNLEAVQQVAQAEPRPITETPLAPLLADNMFDVKSVQDAAATQERVNRLLSEAVSLSQAGQLLEARECVDELLKIRPAHMRARRLKARLDERIQEILPGGGGGAADRGEETGG